MKPCLRSFLSVILFMTLSVGLRADDKTEARLREALKAMAQQLRASQDEVATAEAAQAESDRQLALCKDQLATMTTDFKNLKEKSEADHELAERVFAAYKEQNALLQRTVEDRERKNYELYKTGLEVLDRYKKYSLGEAIEAKEPFVGLTKVELENQVQGYEDKFAENKTYPGQAVTEVKKTEAPNGVSAKDEKSGSTTTAPSDTATAPAAPASTSTETKSTVATPPSKPAPSSDSSEDTSKEIKHRP